MLKLLLTLLLVGSTAQATIVSRLRLDHPALGTAGGSALHTQIQALYTSIGDNMDSRYYTHSAIANSTTVTDYHNFGVAFSELTVLIYTGTHPNLTRVSNPTASGWVIAATSGFLKEKVDITTPSSGGPHTFSVVIIQGSAVEVLDDLDDVDVTTALPEDGQALVYSSSGTKWIPGASGDSSLKCQSVSTPNAVIKNGYLILDSGMELQVASDLTVNLTTVLGSSPANSTAYYLYVDSDGLPAASLLSNGRQVKVVSSASHFSLQTTLPDSVNQARYVPLCVIKSATTGNAWSGTGSAFATLATRRHGRPVVNASPTVYELTQQAVGTIGSSSQIKAGHILASGSFPSFTTETSFYNLTALTDGSGNARTLTNNGTAVFTATNLFGTATAALTLDGTDDSLSSTAAFFNPGNSNSIAMGGWFKATDWTPAGEQCPIGNQQNNTTDRGFAICVQTTGDVHFYGTNTATARSFQVIVPNPAFTNATWHHLAWVFDFAGQRLKAYIDGTLQGQAIMTNQRALTSSVFRIGAIHGTAANFFAGSAEEAFFSTDLYNSDDIHRIYAYRVDHNKAVAVANQNWRAVFVGNQSNQMNQDWLVHETTNSVYWDFTALGATDQVGVSMGNASVSTTVIPIATYTSGRLSAAPSFPISHGLGAIPKDFYVLTQGASLSGQDDKRYDLCSVTSTQINCDLTSLTIDSTHQIEIIASAAPIAVSVPSASDTISGIVTTGTQTFAGLKTFTAATTTLSGTGDTGLSVVGGGGAGARVTLNGASGIIDNITGNLLFRANGATKGSFTQAGVWSIGPSTGTFAGNIIYGVNDATAATAGATGEAVRSAVSSFTNFPAGSTYGDCTSISLTAGDWDVTGCVYFTNNGATVTGGDFGISTTSGTSFTDRTFGDNHTFLNLTSATEDGGCLSNYRVNISGTATYYLKVRAQYSAGTPQYTCRISARRER